MHDVSVRQYIHITAREKKGKQYAVHRMKAERHTLSTKFTTNCHCIYVCTRCVLPQMDIYMMYILCSSLSKKSMTEQQAN